MDDSSVQIVSIWVKDTTLNTGVRRLAPLVRVRAARPRA